MPRALVEIKKDIAKVSRRLNIVTDLISTYIENDTEIIPDNVLLLENYYHSEKLTLLKSFEIEVKNKSFEDDVREANSD